MNAHCQNCLLSHWKKTVVCVLVIVDLLTAARQATLIHINDTNGTLMLLLICVRAVMTWIIFAVAVTTLNRMIECQDRRQRHNQGKGE